jgi:hypothetical protein
MMTTQTLMDKHLTIPSTERPSPKAPQKKFGFEPDRVVLAAKGPSR